MGQYFVTDANGFIINSTANREELISLSRDSIKMMAEEGNILSVIQKAE